MGNRLVVHTRALRDMLIEARSILASNSLSRTWWAFWGV